MLKTERPSLKDMCKALGDMKIEELPDRFRAKVTFGDRTLDVSWSLDRPLCGPGQRVSPFDAISDVYGTFARDFGPGYEQCIVFTKVGTVIFDDDHLTEFHITDAIDGATHALVTLRWAEDCPIPASDPELERRLSISWRARDTQSQEAYNADTLLIPLSRLGSPLRDELNEQYRLRNVAADFAWREYNLTKPYYKQRMAQCVDTLKVIGAELQLDEDYAKLVLCGENDRGLFGSLNGSKWWYTEKEVDAVLQVCSRISAGSNGLPPMILDLISHFPGSVVIGSIGF